MPDSCSKKCYATSMQSGACSCKRQAKFDSVCKEALAQKEAEYHNPHNTIFADGRRRRRRIDGFRYAFTKRNEERSGAAWPGPICDSELQAALSSD